jgi:aspartyl protease family protein
MSKGLLLVVGATALVAVAVGGSMTNQPVAAPATAEITLDSKSDHREPELAQVAQDGVVRLDRSGDGHFYADVQINGASVHALVDTGASAIALSREDARTAGVATSIAMPEVIGRGADGDVYGEQVTLERVVLGHRSAENMPAIVLNAGEQTLLGQNFLARFDAVEIRGDTMVLR